MSELEKNKFENEEYKKNKEELVNFLIEHSSAKSKKERREKIKNKEKDGEKQRRQLSETKERKKMYKKIKKGLNAYQKNMDNYNSKFKESKPFDVTEGTRIEKVKPLTPAQSLFGQYYQKAYIDHKKAMESANKKETEKQISKKEPKTR